jgi:hypothetical protein
MLEWLRGDREALLRGRCCVFTMSNSPVRDGSRASETGRAHVQSRGPFRPLRLVASPGVPGLLRRCGRARCAGGARDRALSTVPVIHEMLARFPCRDDVGNSPKRHRPKVFHAVFYDPAGFFVRGPLRLDSGPALSLALGADAHEFVSIYRFRRYFMDKLIERWLLRAGPLLYLSS